ncbi:metallophosphoesterase [Patescibacteria group bacterium]|nr:metallophosphoesterase [Patescibacteria group bacterium]
MTKRQSFFVFMAIVFSFLFLGNFVVFQAWILMFNIISFYPKLYLALGLSILSLSFVLSIIFGGYYYNRFTRLYYSVTAVWMGYFCYLFMASVVYSAFAGISGYSVSRIGELFILIALATTTYGIFHAKRLIVSEVEVMLPNLPAAWENRKAVWISDLHLGQLHGENYLRKVVNNVNELSAHIVFIGGDLFDGTSAPDLIKLSESLKDIVSIFGTYYITGNHEEMAGHSEAFITAVKASGVSVLMDEMKDLEGLQIVGVDYSNAVKKENFAEILTRLVIDRQKPSILLKHEPKDLEIAEEAGISLQISGHTHRAQIWPLGYIAQATYKGYSYGLKQFRNMQIYTSSGVGTWGPPVRVGTNSEIVLITFKNRN